MIARDVREACGCCGCLIFQPQELSTDHYIIVDRGSAKGPFTAI